MEIARDYSEHFMQVAGLEPAFTTKETLANGSVREVPFSSYRRAFPSAARSRSRARPSRPGRRRDVQLRAIATTPSRAQAARAMSRPMLSLSATRSAKARTASPLLPEGTDLTGKIAVMYRFEPMDDEGSSQWSEAAGATTPASTAS